MLPDLHTNLSRGRSYIYICVYIHICLCNFSQGSYTWICMNTLSSCKYIHIYILLKIFSLRMFLLLLYLPALSLWPQCAIFSSYVQIFISWYLSILLRPKSWGFHDLFPKINHIWLFSLYVLNTVYSLFNAIHYYMFYSF